MGLVALDVTVFEGYYRSIHKVIATAPTANAQTLFALPLNVERNVAVLTVLVVLNKGSRAGEII